MRLRSSQFVFLLLLVCSVQIREEYPSNLMADVIAGRATLTAPHREAVSANADSSRQWNLDPMRSAQAVSLSPADVAARRIVWSMARPALATTATVSHTSFLRV